MYFINVMDDNRGYDIMFPGIYKGYKEGDTPIKADNNISAKDTATLRSAAIELRIHAEAYMNGEKYLNSRILQDLSSKIEEVIGHPKYYI